MVVLAQEAAVVLDTRPGECDRAANSSTISRVDLTFLPPLTPALMTDSICCSSMSVGGLLTLLLVFLLDVQDCDKGLKTGYRQYLPIISGLDGNAVAVVCRLGL